MIPFVSHFVDDVNLAEKRITVDWQPILLELQDILRPNALRCHHPLS